MTEQGTAAGVSFALTDEQKALRDLAREFAEKEIRPVEAPYDEKMQHPADVIAKAHEVGLMNLHIPEEYGGLGLSTFDGLLVGEELYRGCSGIGTSITANGLGAGPVILFGSDEQKATWLPPLVESPILCSFGLSEPGAGSDVAALSTTAVREGDEYVLSGSKTFITNAGYADVDGRVREDRPEGRPPRHVRVHRPDGHARRHDRVAPRQDGPALDRHLGVRAPGRPRPRREPDRRGGRRLQDRDGDARRHASGHRDRRRRRRPGGVRALGRLREGARHLRDADRHAPGRQLHDRRHGDRDRGGAPA